MESDGYEKPVECLRENQGMQPWETRFVILLASFLINDSLKHFRLRYVLRIDNRRQNVFRGTLFYSVTMACT